MKNFLLLFFLLLAGSTKLQAQSYPSIFGRDSTVWYVFANDYDGGLPYRPPTIIYTTKSDTLVNGVTYRKVIAKSTTRPALIIAPFWMRENLNTGKVWSRYFSGNDTVERILMNFTLNVGDTFHMGPAPSAPRMFVDSVYFDSQSRKHIRFSQNALGISADRQKPEFITGIGNNWGLRYTFCATYNCGMYEIGLICAYKDRENIYKDTAAIFGNDCIYPLALNNPKTEKSAFQITPNPVTENLSITLPASAASAVIYNAVGQKMTTLLGATQSLKIDCSQWPPGLYVLRLQDKSGSVSSQTFLKQ